MTDVKKMCVGSKELLVPSFLGLQVRYIILYS
jgi:hypothetical protein